MGYSVRELSEAMGVTPQTIHKWLKTGKIPSHKTPTGRAFFTDDDYNTIIQPTRQQSWAHYARSSCGSKTAINNQLKTLEQAYGTPEHSIKDAGSGLNEKRKGLNKLLDLAKNHEITDIAITSEDRLTRFGYEYLTRYFNDNNVKIHVHGEKSVKAPEQELIDDFMALLASFSGRYYHLRSKENEQKFMNDITKRVNNGEKKN